MIQYVESMLVACKDFNAWAYLLRIFFIGQVSASAGLLLPLRLATRCYLPTTTLVMPFMVLFLLSLGQCGDLPFARLLYN